MRDMEVNSARLSTSYELQTLHNGVGPGDFPDPKFKHESIEYYTSNSPA